MNRAIAPRLDDAQSLADAFSEFMFASAQLEKSYRELQQEVSQLSVELAERNQALTRSLAENDRMRAALQRMLDSLPCGVIVLDTADSIVMINPEGRRLLMLSDAGLTTLSDLSHATQINFTELAASCGDEREAEITLSTGGTKRWLALGRRELRGASVRTASSLHSIWTLRDISAEKKAEQEREAARRAATLAEMSTILAHEIRNPLASLELFAGLIAEDGAANAEWISHLRAGIRTLSGTVNNVLSMHDGSSPRLRQTELVACVQGAVDFMRPLAEQAGVKLAFLSAWPAIAVAGNQDGLRQVILNLVSNAIRHTQAGGSVTVVVEQIKGVSSTQARIEVRDTGCGIASAQLQQVFDAGFSGSGETPGLGLAVCSRIIRQHGGTIGVTSTLGEGTTFQMELAAI